MRVPYSIELSIPILNFETAAYLQQSSIYDWAQSNRSERGRWDVSGVDHSFVKRERWGPLRSLHMLPYSILGSSLCGGRSIVYLPCISAHLWRGPIRGACSLMPSEGRTRQRSGRFLCCASAGIHVGGSIGRVRTIRTGFHLCFPL